jgi:hypothetical protein
LNTAGRSTMLVAPFEEKSIGRRLTSTMSACFASA